MLEGLALCGVELAVRGGHQIRALDDGFEQCRGVRIESRRLRQIVVTLVRTVLRTPPS